MPTDGADFGKMKACYGRLYVALRAGATEADIANQAVKCVEREIRFDGGAPVFCAAVQLAVLISGQPSAGDSQSLIRNIDHLKRLHGDSSSTRYILSATEKVVLAALSQRASLSDQEASKRIISQIARSRCEGTSAYITKHRTGSATETKSFLGSVSGELPSAPSLSDFAGRMLKPSAKGLPAKATRGASIDHSAEGLNNTSLDGGL